MFFRLVGSSRESSPFVVRVLFWSGCDLVFLVLFFLEGVRGVGGGGAPSFVHFSCFFVYAFARRTSHVACVWPCGIRVWVCFLCVLSIWRLRAGMIKTARAGREHKAPSGLPGCCCCCCSTAREWKSPTPAVGTQTATAAR